jgi:serine/threonine protein kinase/tetratricopeptide (TPR) repeat protein
VSQISPERWRALGPYLDEGLELTGDSRSAWLASIRSRDAELGAELEGLFADHGLVQDSGFLELQAPLVEPPIETTTSLQGQILGAYRLASPIGRGGMGSVWLAERCDGRFEGRAAVKLLNTALVGREGEERFRREGNFLAKLTHPHIAHLIDAGVSPTGQPYLVLEYVDGQSIDRYCDEHALGIEARIRLFLDVLEAVAHAHANLIVHRDIKPANVLVDVRGQVKLLDFGIAKLLEDDTRWEGSASAASPLTREAGTALTPSFAAPEQLAHGAVTTATDVHALGVLLYILMTGQHPAGSALHSPLTLIRAITEVDPRRMSDVVAGRDEPIETLERHATRRSTTTNRLRRTLRGDLDTIVAKSLKKSPSDRYGSVTAMAEELRRFLRHEPISARPDTWRYRTARFVTRHVQGVVTTLVVALALTALTIFYTTRLAAERDRAQQEAMRASQEAAKAAKVSEALTGLLMGVDPYANPGARDGLSVRGMLDVGAEQVQSGLAAEPEAQAEIFTVLGRLYRRYGVYDKAQGFLQQALASGQRVFGPEHVSVAQTLNDLGALQSDQGDYESALRTLEQALALRRRLLGNEHEDVAVTLVEIGRIYQDQGFNGRAEPLFREALAIRRKVLGPEHGEVANSMTGVAAVLRLNGDLVAAEAMLRDSLSLNRKARGEEHANSGTSLHDLALVVAARGDYNRAESMLRQALNTHRKAMGNVHPIVATTLNALSHVLVAQERHAEAAAALEEALKIARPAFGTTHPLVAIYTINLGAVQMARNQPADAEALIREGLRVRQLAPGIVPSRRRTFVEDDWSLGATKSLLGASLVAQRRYEEAEAQLLEARRDLEAMPTPPRRDIVVTLNRLVELYGAWGKHDKAAFYRAQLPS